LTTAEMTASEATTTEVAPTAEAAVTAAATMTTAATTGERVSLNRRDSQSDNRQDDTDLAQHGALHTRT
jgi:hypothetical protein